MNEVFISTCGALNLDVCTGVYIYKKLTAWSRILLGELTGSQLIKKFPALYGTRIFITACTRARHLSLFGTGGGLLCMARSIQSMPLIQLLEEPF